jgi:anaerobic magnesium-protoporphyrin IX monomethyl ester cyclase
MRGKIKTCDVLLVNPPTGSDVMPTNEIILNYFKCIDRIDLLGDSDTEPNYGLFSIAAYLRQGCEQLKMPVSIEYVDLNSLDINLRRGKENRAINKNDMAKILSKYKCRVAGVSFMTASYGTWAEMLIPVVKQSSDYVFLGGIHPSVRYKEVMKKFSEQISGIVVGEGEEVFFNVVQRVLQGNGHGFERIRHLYTRKKLKNGHGGKISRARLDYEFLSKLPNPAYNISFKRNAEVIARVYSSRGCDNKCSMCSVAHFFNSEELSEAVDVYVDKLIEKIDEIYKKYNVKHFVLGDLTTSNRERLVKFLYKLIDLNKELIKRKKTPKKWWCQTRGDSSIIDKTTAELLKEAGFEQVAIGCEGATDKQLATINKEEKVVSIKNALKTLRDAGLSTQGYWIIGLPYDTEKSVEKTQEAILEYLESGLVTVPHITVLVPYPNTGLAKNSGNNGIKIINKDYKNYWMNCDLYGCGRPVYETIDAEGNTVLTSDRIYKLWLETLQKVTDFYNSREESGI